MVVVVAGEPILSGMVSGPCSVGVPREGSVYICRQLTVTEVRKALQAGVVGVISASGNFACHAANLLRSARRRGTDIVWIRGLAVDHASSVVISPDGRCTFDREAAVLATDGTRLDLDQFVFRPKRSSWDRVSLWPNRPYTVAEFDLARAGLEFGATQLADRAVKVHHWRGRIWFQTPSLTSADLLQFASDSARSVPYLERMVSEYTEIVARFRGGDHSHDLPFLFFSTLLPFHKSYGAVMTHMLRGLSANQTDISDLALTNGVVQWLDQTPQFQTSAKVAGDETWDGLLPPKLPADYVRQTLTDLIQSFPTLNRSVAYWLALLVVVKEFKMVISKNIYARYLNK
ncbi:hypothetical protein ARZXY2_4903 (plasmid) [Arthrobacter sp. ZXY-2]|nr:hypothetical protein ARZXY2_4903 [Arthrobacter sp. ZXY-2]